MRYVYRRHSTTEVSPTVSSLAWAKPVLASAIAAVPSREGGDNHTVACHLIDEPERDRRTGRGLGMSQSVTIAQARLMLSEPHDCSDSNDLLTIFHAVFDTLIRRVGQDFAPHLAERWDLSADARTWTFHLRAGVTFHDGTPCDADAVRQSLIRMARQDKGHSLGSPAVWRQYLGGAEIDVSDARTVVVRLAEPMADLLDVLEQGFIVAPSSFPAHDAGRHDQPVGSGPYRIVSASAEEIRAQGVEGHFAGTPENAVLVWRREPDPAERLALLMAGEVQIADALDFHASKALEGTAAVHLEYLSPVAIIYLLNAARGPLSDARVRLALSLAVDRPALIEDVVSGAAQPLLGFVSPAHYGAGDGAGPARDLTTARALLAEAGYADGLTLEVDCPTRLPDEAERLTACFGAQLADIGVRLEVHLHQDREAYAHIVRRKEIRDLCVFDSSPMSTFRVLYEKIDGRVRGAWWQGFHNPAVEALIDRGRVTANRDQRAAIYAEAYAELQRDPPWLTLYNPTRVIGLAGTHPDFTMPADGVIDAAGLPKIGAAHG